MARNIKKKNVLKNIDGSKVNVKIFVISKKYFKKL